MKGSEHLLFGIGAGVLTAYCFHATIAAPGPVVLSCVLGSLYPDIDLATSKLGHKVKPVAIAVNKLFGHRNFVHSPLNCALITALVYLLFSYVLTAAGHWFRSLRKKYGMKFSLSAIPARSTCLIFRQSSALPMRGTCTGSSSSSRNTGKNTQPSS